MLKLNVLPFHDSEPNEEELRPSSQVNICNEETIGTFRDCAAATIASEPCRLWLIGVHVHRERAIEALRTESIVEQSSR